MKRDDEGHVMGSFEDAEGPRGEASKEAAAGHEMSPALVRVVAELRAERAPELPWDAVERELMRRIERGEGGQISPQSGHVLRQLLPICAAAAAIALAVNFGARAGEEGAAMQAGPRLVDASLVALAPGLAGDRGDRDLSALREGDAIEAADAPISFARAGVVRWTLAPRSRAVVRSAGANTGVGMIVALDRGSIRAEVTPRDPAEGLVDAFAVEAGGARVAVHGTAFSVLRAEQSIVVDVEHGVVAVGPAGHRGSTAGYSLVGPSRASFSLDGGQAARLLHREEQPIERGALALAEPPPRPVSAPAPSPIIEPLAPPRSELAAQADPASHAAPTPIAAAPPAPSARVVQQSQPAPLTAETVKTESPPEPPAPPPVVLLTPSSVKSRIERCIKDAQIAHPSSVKVSIASTLSIRVADDGSIVSARLNPPLAPHLTSCAGAGISGKFAAGPETLTIPLYIDE